MIKNIIKKINEKKIVINLNSINYIISLKDCEDENNKFFYEQNYELKPCNSKTFKPLNDYPNYYTNSLLKEFTNELISFVSKNEINIMLIENYNDLKINDNIFIVKEKNRKKENKINKEKKCINYCLLI